MKLEEFFNWLNMKKTNIKQIFIAIEVALVEIIVAIACYMIFE
jgi:hypothetical protein